MYRNLGIYGVLAGAVLVAGAADAEAQTDAAAPYRTLTSAYCISCHNTRARAGGLELDSISGKPVADHADAWEKVARKLRARQMPPVGSRRPDEATYVKSLAALEASLDAHAAAAPNPGRTEPLRRLNRTEYANAIRDLLHLDADAASLLPADSVSYGFDNITVGTLSPTLLESYVAAAEKISRLAIGRPGLTPGGATVRIRPDLTQEKHIEGLPLGTRGGALVAHTFPANAEYAFTIRLARDRNEHVEGLQEAHDVELLVDGERAAFFTVQPHGSSHEAPDAHLTVRVPVAAGPHRVGVTFPKKPLLLSEGVRQPYEARFNYYRHPRTQPAVYEISIVGPYNATGSGDTPSRRRIFSCAPESADAKAQDACGQRILAALMRRAYRRPVNDADLSRPLALYRAARQAGGFEAGIEMGLSAILASPEFIFRVERDRPGAAPGTVYRISDLELASRLSFFLWSSIPDDELLAAAEKGELSKPAVLDRHVARMLADPRSRNLIDNFAAQWLHLRNLDGIAPDMRLFPDFDDNLRQAFRRETELFLESVMREDRSVLDLIAADYTFVNERLAKHYGIPNVYGSRFRKISFGTPASSKPGAGQPAKARGGLLRHGSILMVTSYPTRTSPVIRGKWVLDNLLGVPPPPPPADVPALEDVKIARTAPMRDRLAQHRANAACAGCHRLMDPIGFALEHYDAVGRWRDKDGQTAIDASGLLFDGTKFDGTAGLEAAILRHPDLFVTTLTEKLMTFAIGRGVEHYDASTVRAIVRDAAKHNNRFSSLISGIVRSRPFQMRTAS